MYDGSIAPVLLPERTPFNITHTKNIVDSICAFYNKAVHSLFVDFVHF